MCGSQLTSAQVEPFISVRGRPKNTMLGTAAHQPHHFRAFDASLRLLTQIVIYDVHGALPGRTTTSTTLVHACFFHSLLTKKCIFLIWLLSNLAESVINCQFSRETSINYGKCKDLIKICLTATFDLPLVSGNFMWTDSHKETTLIYTTQ